MQLPNSKIKPGGVLPQGTRTREHKVLQSALWLGTEFVRILKQNKRGETEKLPRECCFCCLCFEHIRAKPIRLKPNFFGAAGISLLPAICRLYSVWMTFCSRGLGGEIRVDGRIHSSPTMDAILDRHMRSSGILET